MTCKINVRPAEPRDVPACVRLVEERRVRYEGYQPQFWKKAANSAELSAARYTRLLDDGESICLVVETENDVAGFLIASPFPAPPVYDPGGPNAIIDDFAVTPGRWPELGGKLLAQAKDTLRAGGFVQIIVVGARQDTEKSEFLAAANLSLASTWWTAGL